MKYGAINKKGKIPWMTIEKDSIEEAEQAFREEYKKLYAGNPQKIYAWLIVRVGKLLSDLDFYECYFCQLIEGK